MNVLIVSVNYFIVKYFVYIPMKIQFDSLPSCDKTFILLYDERYYTETFHMFASKTKHVGIVVKTI